MNWGQLAVLSLDPNRRGMMGLNSGLAGKRKPWKAIGITKSEYKATLSTKKGLFESQFTDMTKEEARSQISSLKEKAGAEGLTKGQRKALQQSIRAAKKAKRSITRQDEWATPSITEKAPPPEEPPDETPPPGNIWNTDPNGVPVKTADILEDPKAYGATTLQPSGSSTVNITSPGGPGTSGPTTGMTMWDTVLNVTGGNKTVLLAGAGVLVYLFFFRKKR